MAEEKLMTMGEIREVVDACPTMMAADTVVLTHEALLKEYPGLSPNSPEMELLLRKELTPTMRRIQKLIEAQNTKK